MSDIQETTTIVVPAEDQPSEDASITTPAVVTPDPPSPAEAAVAAHDQANTAGNTEGQVTVNNDPVQSAAAPATPGTRAPASDLEGDLRKVLDDYVEGKFVLPEGSLPTPHTLAAEIAKRRADGKSVSSGAVSAALARWQEIGFATLGTKPTQFIDYTDAARAQGLNAMKQAHRASKSAARKAVKEPAPVAASTPAPEAPVAEAAVVPAAEPAWEQGYPVSDTAVAEQPVEAAVADTSSDGTTPF
jgi:hypothetical protein